MFSFHELPNSYLANNPNSEKLRKQLIVNQTKISECSINDIEDFFFSDENIDLINKKLILSIYKITKGEYKIENQAKENLLIVMRYIFIEYCKHLPYNIIEQIKELNCKVINEIVPMIITNITQHTKYLEDIQSGLKLLSLPINTQKNKTLRSVTTTF
jgi:hypothetical protein